MNCNAPLPCDDEGPFPPDDELFPDRGVTPRDAGNERGRDPLRAGAWIVLGVVAVLVGAVVVAVLVRGGGA